MHFLVDKKCSFGNYKLLSALKQRIIQFIKVFIKFYRVCDIILLFFIPECERITKAGKGKSTADISRMLFVVSGQQKYLLF